MIKMTKHLSQIQHVIFFQGVCQEDCQMGVLQPDCRRCKGGVTMDMEVNI